MEIRWKNDGAIEDLRNHSTTVVASLRDTLEHGAVMVADAKRPGFYESETETQTFYVHVHEQTGKVMLLATWPSVRAMEAACACA
jgi:hypothetical protein